MPRKTFFKLEPAKQEQIISESVKLFAKSSFNEVKIAAIIREAGIPRSSFYDYFEDKLDLYSYIILMVSERKNEYMKTLSFGGDFFEDLGKYFEAGLNFMAREPELDAMSRQFLKDKEMIRTIFGEESTDVSATFETMLEQGIADGHIRNDINIGFIARTLSILSSELMLDAVKNSEDSLEDIIREIAEELIKLLKHGLLK